MIRDVLEARLAQMKASGAAPDYQQLARDVLGIGGAGPELARRLVEQALVIEDRRESWRRVGARVRAEAPDAPGVYVFRDAGGRAIYVGKAANLRRRLGAHFADRRWRALDPAVARVTEVEWQTAGSELEALLREATAIDELQPIANIQVGEPALRGRAVPSTLIRDVLVLVPSVDSASVEIVGARSQGSVMTQRTARSGAGLAGTTALFWEFFHAAADRGPSAGTGLAPIVFSWLAGRGRHATRVDPHDAAAAGELEARLASLLHDTSLFVERLVAFR